jgi:serine/threonine protein kinase
MVCYYLNPRELALTIPRLSKYWHKITSQETKLWEMVDTKVSNLSINERLQVLACIVERRSKGKLFMTKDRVTGKKYLLRKIYLDVTNAGQDDGLPTSVLREISHLKALKHPNIS